MLIKTNDQGKRFEFLKSLAELLGTTKFNHIVVRFVYGVILTQELEGHRLNYSEN